MLSSSPNQLRPSVSRKSLVRQQAQANNNHDSTLRHAASEGTFIFDDEAFNRAGDVEDADEYERIAQKLNRSLEDEPDAQQKLQVLTQQVSNSNCSDWYDKRHDEKAEFDFAEVLSSSVRRMDQEGLELNHIGVTFAGLTTKGVSQTSIYGPSVSDPIRTISNLPSLIKGAMDPPLKNIIEDVDGFVEAGEMLMVVGRPGAGCTTFLKTLAGDVDQYNSIEGDIEYDGIPYDEMLKSFKSDIIYNGEGELYFARHSTRYKYMLTIQF